MYQPGKVCEMLGGRIRYVFAGKPANYNPRAIDSSVGPMSDEVLLNTQNVKWELEAKRIFAPVPGKTNLVVSRESVATFYIRSDYRFIRTVRAADGAVVDDFDTALAFFTADCLIVVMVVLDSQRWFLLHVGIDNLLINAKDDKGKPIFDNRGWIITDTVIDRAFILGGGDPTNYLVAYGFGIGPCCNGYRPGTDKLEQLHLCHNGIAVLGGDRKLVAKGVRKGQIAVDLMAVVREKFQTLGFQPDQIEEFPACTSCWNDGQVFFSSAQGDLERNCAMFRRVK